MGMLSAVSIVMVLFVRIPFPLAPYLVYDGADVPILLGAFLFGPLPGMLVLTIVSAIQAFLLPNGNGIIGFVMHMMSSGAFVLISSLLYRRLGQSNRSIIVSLTLGGLGMAILMIPLNLIFTPMLFGMPMAAVANIILPVLLPFNLSKAVIVSVLFFLLFKSLRLALKDKAL
jgi:riboflavin transporter FmnP